MARLTDYFHSDAGVVDPQDALTANVAKLLGVSADAATELAQHGVSTVFDLAMSTLFANAQRLVAAADDPEDPIALYGQVPADMAAQDGMTVPALADGDVGALVGLTADATAFSSALGVSSIRDLASWPPYLAARQVLSQAYGIGDIEDDPEAPADLLPSSGLYPTERVYYSTLLFDGFVTGAAANGSAGARAKTARVQGTKAQGTTGLQSRLPAGQFFVPGNQGQPAVLEPISVPLESAGAIDVAAVESGGVGFALPALGALIRFEQSWYRQGVTLGQLLHSAALAPGESTRIAMIDWSRRVSGQRSETGSESQSLANDTSHTRSIGEVTSAVAQEAQSGFSHSDAQSTTTQSGQSSAGLSLSSGNLIDAGIGLLTGGGGFSPSLSGGSSSTATTGTTANSWSNSSGSRDIEASMSQKVADATHQAANASRNRRATVVQEVSEQEAATATTRVVTNYNHMHAMSVQYYEVVQVYRTETSIASVDKVLYIPFRLRDLNDGSLTSSEMMHLAAAALDSTAARLLAEECGFAFLTLGKDLGNWDAVMFDPGTPDALQGAVSVSGPVLRLPADSCVESITSSVSLNVDFTLVNMPTQDTDTVTLNGTSAEVPPNAQQPIGDFTTVRLPLDPPDSDVTLTIRFAVGEIHASCSFTIPKGTDPFYPIGIKSKASDPERAWLRQHLAANSLYYNQVLLSCLDASMLSLALSKYTFGGRPLAELLDPTPCGMVANYLAFRMQVDPSSPEGQAWQTWLTDHGITQTHRNVQMVPLPTGGVFAEAVLGRFNSAEKLDITRFWNWQDSPIPIEAPEIQPVSTDSRQSDPNLTPGQFGAPMVNIVAPTSLPDPTGLAAALSAVQNGNMFRDMSGLAATIGLAQSAAQDSSAGATAAGAQAGQNMATFAQMVEALAAGAAGAPVVPPGPGAKNISNAGAAINHGRAMDAARGGAGAGLPGGSSGAPVSAGSSSGSSLSGGNGTMTSMSAGVASGSVGPGAQIASNGTGYEASAFDNAVLGGPAAAGSTAVGTGDNGITQVVFTSEQVDLLNQRGQAYVDLLDFMPPADIMNELTSRNMWVQTYAAAIGDLNLDYYPVRVTKLPSVNSQQLTAEQLLEHVRLNLNDLIDTSVSKFSPYEVGTDDVKWSSSSPAGAVIFIAMLPLYDASVVTSLAESSRWRFTTIHSPNAGYHPVTGNREFGFIQTSDGGWEFYTRGADRATGATQTVLSSVAWAKANQLWLSLQSGIASFVNGNGGSATVEPKFQHAFNWGLVVNMLNPSQQPQTI